MIYKLYRDMGNGLEHGFYAETTSKLTPNEKAKLHQILADKWEPEKTREESFFSNCCVVEIGPRRSMETSYSTNGTSICKNAGLEKISRIERTRRILLGENETTEQVLVTKMDKMLEEHYQNGMATFLTKIVPAPSPKINLKKLGKAELVKQNRRLNIGFDDFLLDFVYSVFSQAGKRNPTYEELLALLNALSEHCRHPFYKGVQIIDGIHQPATLMELVQKPLAQSQFKRLSYRAFKDSGMMRGFTIKCLIPENSRCASKMRELVVDMDFIATAETHSHPTGAEPYNGAGTGTGGRKGDIHTAGRGGYCGISVAGYATANLFIPDYKIPGEVVGYGKRSPMAQPLEILLKGSNGIADYDNQHGEPCTGGFTRTFEQIVDGEWVGFRKPNLYSGGVGQILHQHVEKGEPAKGMTIICIGGLARPVGFGGGNTSSKNDNTINDALNSVQRGDAEYRNKVGRVVTGCIELLSENPIVFIQDQGAGGVINNLLEILERVGGHVDISKIKLADTSMSNPQIVICEYQERYGMLVPDNRVNDVTTICERERVNCEILGQTGKTGGKKRVIFYDGKTDPKAKRPLVDFDLEEILTKFPQRTYATTTKAKKLTAPNLGNTTIDEAVKMVFQLPAVGSKGFLVHKKDRSVGGKVAQQQCCGIAQIPISDYTILAQSALSYTGCAVAIGENPVRTLISPEKSVRMAIGEAITNIAGAHLEQIQFVNVSRSRWNWMWPAKIPHQGAELYAANKAASNFAIELGESGLEVAPDGGKDSLSMVYTVEGQTVRAPGHLVVLLRANMPDIREKITPDIKMPGQSKLGLIDLGLGKNRLGGSALLQALNQIGDDCPDVDCPKLLVRSFKAVQELVWQNLILSLHDRSDGGLITAVAEMCMASRCGFVMKINDWVYANKLAQLFSEELGWVIEYTPVNEQKILQIFRKYDVPFNEKLGHTTVKHECIVHDGTDHLLHRSTEELRTWWEETSSQLEKLQSNPACAQEEHAHHAAVLPGILEDRSYKLNFAPEQTAPHIRNCNIKPEAIILREEGVNGDREMHDICHLAGFTTWDVNMEDLKKGFRFKKEHQVIIFPGGFSYMDVFGSAVGWRAAIEGNKYILEMLEEHYERPDTCSFGVCNGFQLQTELGWLPWRGIPRVKQPRLNHNVSGKFESRWVQVEILDCKSIMFSNMRGCRLPVWIAHAEGCFQIGEALTKATLFDNQLVPMVFIDPFENQTTTYPYNPNGSDHGITAICSKDGRHTGMMPHIERLHDMSRFAWAPTEWYTKLEASPWLRPFQNLRSWCEEHR